MAIEAELAKAFKEFTSLADAAARVNGEVETLQRQRDVVRDALAAALAKKVDAAAALTAKRREIKALLAGD